MVAHLPQEVQGCTEPLKSFYPILRSPSQALYLPSLPTTPNVDKPGVWSFA